LSLTQRLGKIAILGQPPRHEPVWAIYIRTQELSHFQQFIFEGGPGKFLNHPPNCTAELFNIQVGCDG